MFSSNQILDVSGGLDQVALALKFALEYSEHIRSFSEPDSRRTTIFQITKSGKYCIGWSYGDIPEGWEMYQFRPDITIISAIIRQHLESFPIHYGGGDGSYVQGFQMRALGETYAYESEEIKNPHYCLVYFEPFTCFYHK